MLIISASMVKSGSAWFINLLNDLLSESGFSDTNWIRNTFNLTFVKWSEFNIQELTKEKFDILTNPPVSNYTFVVKTHYPPNKYILDLIKSNRVKVTYIYRDPRDIVLSGLDAGVKLRERGVYERFGNLYTFDQTVNWCLNKLKKSWGKWSKLESVKIFRYEDLNDNPLNELKKVAGFLDLEVNDSTIKKVVKKHSSEKLKEKNLSSYHFNKGISYRYKKEMTERQLEFCKHKFDRFLNEMGYERK